MKFACVTSAEQGAVNRALSGLALHLLDQGVRVIGATQHDTPRPNSRLCDMDVRILPDGAVIRISQNLGENARGCRLDPGALETAVAQTAARLDGADILIVNKFGKHEAEGRGFRDVIAGAILRDIPVIVGTNRMNIDAFRAFCDNRAEALPPDLPRLLDWARASLRRAA